MISIYDDFDSSKTLGLKTKLSAAVIDLASGIALLVDPAFDAGLIE